MLLDRF